MPGSNEEPGIERRHNMFQLVVDIAPRGSVTFAPAMEKKLSFSKLMRCSSGNEANLADDLTHEEIHEENSAALAERYDKNSRSPMACTPRNQLSPNWDIYMLGPDASVHAGNGIFLCALCRCSLETESGYFVHAGSFFSHVQEEAWEEMGTTVSYFRGTVGPSGFSSNSTAENVTANLDLNSKTVIVTGATSGIGKECARVLVKRGAHVVLAVRNVKLGETVCEEIRKETPAARLDVMHLDLNSLSSVREFAANFKSRNLPLNILINNAGLLQMKFDLSEDGVEKIFATNHLGHFLLTDLLLDVMKATAKESKQEGRIVNVASFAHIVTYRNHDLDQLSNPKRFMGIQAYGLSKLANILHAKELSRRLQEEGANVTVNALHPGTMDTGLGKDESCFKTLLVLYFALAKKLLKTIPQAAATSCYVATNPKLEGVSGKYFFDCNEHLPELPAACDMQLADTYWKFSEELIASKDRENGPQLHEAS